MKNCKKLVLTLMMACFLAGCAKLNFNFSKEKFAELNIGMTKAQVEQIVGAAKEKDYSTQYGAKLERWTYANPITLDIMRVHFQEGRVTRVDY